MFTLLMTARQKRKVRPMNLTAFALAGICLAGCAPTNTAFVGPSGATDNTTKCSRSPEECFQTAAKTCGGPYAVIDSESHAGGVFADIVPGPVTWYRMTYECGRAGASYPSFPFRGPQYTQPLSANEVPVYRRPTQTNCNVFGNNMSCQTY